MVAMTDTSKLSFFTLCATHVHMIIHFKGLPYSCLPEPLVLRISVAKKGNVAVGLMSSGGLDGEHLEEPCVGNRHWCEL